MRDHSRRRLDIADSQSARGFDETNATRRGIPTTRSIVRCRMRRETEAIELSRRVACRG